MTTVTKTSTTSINATADAVWEELDSHFLDISKWAGGVKSSVANPATPMGFNGSTHGGRICDVDGIGPTDERITNFDADTRTLTYSIRAEGLPFFVEGLQNTWTVRSDGPDRSVVDVEIVGTTKGIVGKLAAFPFGRMLGKGAAGLPADLKNHLERHDTT
jgi:hypothetical protein